jgi:hypothetical protein
MYYNENLTHLFRVEFVAGGTAVMFISGNFDRLNVEDKQDA